MRYIVISIGKNAVAALSIDVLINLNVNIKQANNVFHGKKCMNCAVKIYLEVIQAIS